MKKIKIYIVTIIILLIVFLLFLFVNSPKSSEGIGSAGISLEEFNQIEIGMTQHEVDSIIDADKLWNDDEIYDKACIKLNEENNNSIYTYKYKYLGHKSGYAIIVFSVDYTSGMYGLEYPKVISKEDFNLK